MYKDFPVVVIARLPSNSSHSSCLVSLIAMIWSSHEFPDPSVNTQFGLGLRNCNQGEEVCENMTVRIFFFLILEMFTYSNVTRFVAIVILKMNGIVSICIAISLCSSTRCVQHCLQIKDISVLSSCVPFSSTHSPGAGGSVLRLSLVRCLSTKNTFFRSFFFPLLTLLGLFSSGSLTVYQN